MLGLIFPICDADERHFTRFYNELTRLCLPFATHFDHCCPTTEQLFRNHPLFVGAHSDNDPDSFFDESSRNTALGIIKRAGFSSFIHMDVDETLEKEAPQKLKGYASLDFDIIGMRVLNLWGDRLHYRTDCGGNHTREKMFNLLVDPDMRYYHPTTHAPKVKPVGRDADVTMVDCHILHWGIMSHEDAAFHGERWRVIYTRKVGGDPYGTYQYLADRNNKVELAEVPKILLNDE